MILYLKSIFVFMPKIMVTELINLVVLYKPRFFRKCNNDETKYSKSKINYIVYIDMIYCDFYTPILFDLSQFA